MPAHYPVPIQEDLRDLLHDLLGRGVAVEKGDPLRFDEDISAVAVELLGDDGSVQGLCLFDDGFAVRGGAALVMVPANVAEQDLVSGQLDSHVEVVGEVVNVLSRLVNSPSTPHLRLGPTHRWPGELPDRVRSVLERPEFRRDFALTIEGYGDGRLSLLVL